jgi:peptidyl-prolyl cis-trans isomerase SurA
MGSDKHQFPIFASGFGQDSITESRSCSPAIYNDVYTSGIDDLTPAVSNPMTQRPFRTFAAFVFGTLLLASSTQAQTHPAVPESPYGGNTVEDIIARVNDQIITRSDYDRAMKELDAEARQHGATMQEISDAHKDLLRNLIDQQLLLSKGKELGINGETELVNRLNEIRKQYNLETLEDLEKAAKDQGLSFEDFKANLRNGIISQQVLRDQVGRKVQFTPGEVQRYFEAHKQEYARPESENLSEILIAVGPGPLTPKMPGTAPVDDPDALAAAKAKADDIEAKLHAGGDFAQLARSFSDGTTAAEGGDLGQFQRGKMAPVLEDATFALETGQVTEPIRTRQGYIIFKVVQHVHGGIPAYKDVEQQVGDAFYASRMEPAMRDFQTTMREQAFIEIKPGYADSGASPKQTKPIYSAYIPPAPKKKKKVERTRFRESTRSFRQKTTQAAAPADEAAVPAKASKKDASLKAQKPGKKEKIRFGQAPTKTLPSAPAPAKTEDAGAVDQAAADIPPNPLETRAKPTEKTRFSARAKLPKQQKAKGPQPDKLAPAAPDAAEVADRQTQAAPLGLAGDTASKKKKKKTTESEKTRLANKSKEAAAAAKPPAPEMTPAPQVPGAPGAAIPPPAPVPAPAPAPQQ